MSAPESRVERAAARLLAVGAILAMALLVWSAWNRGALTGDQRVLNEFLKFYAVPLLVIGAVLFWLSLTRLVSPLLSLVTLGSVVVALYMAEVYIAWSLVDEKGKLTEAAETYGLTPDFRSEWDVTQDLRRQNVNAHPFFRPLTDPRLLPLGNSPNRTIVYCNEMGQRMVFRADRHGFNNPGTVWDRPGNSIVLLGDSFVHGACSPDNTGVGTLLLRHGRDVLNLGIGGNGPQLNLGTLIEYAIPRRPDVVVWVHYAGNDLSNMMTARDNTLLNRYVNEPQFSQNLIARGPEISAFMDDFFQNRVTPEFAAKPAFSFWRELFSRRGLVKAAKLETLRMVLGITRNVSDEVDFDLFERIMGRAAAAVQAGGNRLVVLLMPAAGQLRAHADSYERETERRLRARNIEFINLRPLMLEAEDPPGLFTWRMRGGHLSPRGNSWLADLIDKDVLTNRQ
jgi:hypothetical protein